MPESCSCASGAWPCASGAGVPKDVERSSLFDILMDQLERTDEFGDSARAVRKWKETVREYYLRSKHNFSDIQKRFSDQGIPIDTVTIRSWTVGGAMAPQKRENLDVLIEILNISGQNSQAIFTAVKNLRRIARLMGRALNTILLTRNKDNIDTKIRATIDAAGIDLEEIMGAVEARKVSGISGDMALIRPEHVGNIFKRTFSNQ